MALMMIIRNALLGSWPIWVPYFLFRQKVTKRRAKASAIEFFSFYRLTFFEKKGNKKTFGEIAFLYAYRGAGFSAKVLRQDFFFIEGFVLLVSVGVPPRFVFWRGKFLSILPLPMKPLFFPGLQVGWKAFQVFGKWKEILRKFLQILTLAKKLG